MKKKKAKQTTSFIVFNRRKQEKKVLKAFIKEAKRQQTLDEETIRINQKLYDLNNYS